VQSRRLHRLPRAHRTPSPPRIVKPVAVAPCAQRITSPIRAVTLATPRSVPPVAYNPVCCFSWSNRHPASQFQGGMPSTPQSPFLATVAQQVPQLVCVSACSSPVVPSRHLICTPKLGIVRDTRVDKFPHGAKSIEQQSTPPLTPTAAGSSDDDLEPLADSRCSDDERSEGSLSQDHIHSDSELERRSTDNGGVANGEPLIQYWETELWADMKSAVTEAQAVPSSCADVAQLSAIKARLNSMLFAAKDANMHELALSTVQQQRRRIHNMIEDAKGQVRVYCRVRPLNAKEASRGDVSVLQLIDDMGLAVPNGSTFACDGIYAPGSQEKIFEDCRDLVQSAIDGTNVTIFSYGNTGTGKTYTMYGNHREDGIAQRTIREVFEVAMGLNDSCSVTVSATMLELYNDRLIDLLPQNAGIQKLRVRQDGAGKVRVDGLQEHVANNEIELLDLFASGKRKRSVAGNAMNEESSRSHVIFTVMIKTVNLHKGETLSGKIVLCDLGGAEQLKKSGVRGHQVKEAIELNRSLTALGDVIHAVAAKQKSIPYRNHKLTQLLQDSIGGSAKTLMFVTCSPATSNLGQTMMTLNYAARVKKITNSGAPSMSPQSTPRSSILPSSP